MAFPDEIVTFPTMMDITESDGELVAQYQIAMQNQDMETASEILASIPDYTKKIITASYLNSIGQTVQNVETYFLERYSPAYVVSATQPIIQSVGDFWFELTE